jgi:hypothetical protein
MLRPEPDRFTVEHVTLLNVLRDWLDDTPGDALPLLRASLGEGKGRG